MKIKAIPLLMKIFALVAIMNLIGCVEREEPCPMYECQRPNLNGQLAFAIQFCTEESDESCYQDEDLTSVLFTTKYNGSDYVVASQVIEDLNMTDYTIGIGVFGGREIYFGDSHILEEVEYSYEISLDSISTDYVLDDFKVLTLGEPCECPSYSMDSLSVNGIRTEVVDNSILLKK